MTQGELLNEYISKLIEWNNTVNLVQADSLRNVYERHIKDSLQIRDCFVDTDYIIDIGSGAGLPGMILSICGFSKVVLCEKNFKKCVFLQEVKNTLNLNCTVYNGDVYGFQIPDSEKNNAFVVSRAFGSLKKLLYVMTTLGVDRGVFHKGVNYKDEVREAELEFVFNHSVKQSVTNPGSAIIIVNGIRRKNGGCNIRS